MHQHIILNDGKMYICDSYLDIIRVNLVEEALYDFIPLPIMQQHEFYIPRS